MVWRPQDWVTQNVQVPDRLLLKPNLAWPLAGWGASLTRCAHSPSADYLRVKVVGSTTTTLLQELGAADDDDAVWASFSGSLTSYAGQTVYLLIEAADTSGTSLVEAAVDDVLVVAQ